MLLLTVSELVTKRQADCSRPLIRSHPHLHTIRRAQSRDLSSGSRRAFLPRIPTMARERRLSRRLRLEQCRYRRTARHVHHHPQQDRYHVYEILRPHQHYGLYGPERSIPILFQPPAMGRSDAAFGVHHVGHCIGSGRHARSGGWDVGGIAAG